MTDVSHLKYRSGAAWDKACRFGPAAAWPVIDSHRKLEALLEEFVVILATDGAHLEVPGASELIGKYGKLMEEGQEEGV